LIQEKLSINAGSVSNEYISLKYFTSRFVVDPAAARVMLTFLYNPIPRRRAVTISTDKLRLAFFNFWHWIFTYLDSHLIFAAED